jgi:hypothetical protein
MSILSKTILCFNCLKRCTFHGNGKEKCAAESIGMWGNEYDINGHLRTERES